MLGPAASRSTCPVSALPPRRCSNGQQCSFGKEHVSWPLPLALAMIRRDDHAGSAIETPHMTLNAITLQNFRCFRERQTARLAPLTLLVGDNSTGKTSFLALIRALWDAGVGNRVPDFKESPYDLGSFEEIAHHRGGRAGSADAFEAAFDADTIASRLPSASRGRPRFRYAGHQERGSVDSAALGTGQAVRATSRHCARRMGSRSASRSRVIAWR